MQTHPEFPLDVWDSDFSKDLFYSMRFVEFLYFGDVLTVF